MTAGPDSTGASIGITRGERARRITALTRLVRIIVHDDNNLAAALESNIASLDEHLSRTGAERHYLDNLTKDVQFTKARIKSLQAYLEDGLAVVEPVQVAVLLDGLKEPVRQMLPAACSLTVTSDPALPAVPMALPLARQAILNTAVNACEAMAECGGGLQIKASMRDGASARPDDIFLLEYLRPEPMLGLEIANNGPPVDAATREQLFDPGFTTHLRGPGLGLSAVLGTMLTHHGCIEVPAQTDGFTLRMLFPLKAPPRGARVIGDRWSVIGNR